MPTRKNFSAPFRRRLVALLESGQEVERDRHQLERDEQQDQVARGREHEHPEQRGQQRDVILGSAPRERARRARPSVASTLTAAETRNSRFANSASGSTTKVPPNSEPPGCMKNDQTDRPIRPASETQPHAAIRRRRTEEPEQQDDRRSAAEATGRASGQARRSSAAAPIRIEQRHRRGVDRRDDRGQARRRTARGRRRGTPARPTRCPARRAGSGSADRRSSVPRRSARTTRST